MTKREQLIEQYEDAAFSLVMDKVAASEGEKYLRLNRQLKDDPTAEVPENVMRRAEKTIGKAFRKTRTISAAKTFCNVVNKVAVLFLTISMVFATAFTASADFRASTYSFVMRVFDDHYEYGFDSKTEYNEVKSYTTFNLGWIPQGYSFCQGVRGTDSYSETYQNFSGGYLIVSLVALGANGVAGTDAEGVIQYQGIINGRNVIIYENNCYNITIPIAESRQVLHVIASSQELPLESVRKIIESLVLE